MPRMFAMPEDCHQALKSRAGALDITMTYLLRMALADYFGDPSLNPADARVRGVWYVVIYMWRDEGLEYTLRATIASTAELPDLAARACREAHAPAEGVAEYVRSGLPRFRQNLARVQSSSLRVANDPWLCQIDVHRDSPQE